jgi:hypothetical protein
MGKMGLKVVKVTQGGWRPSKQSVEKIMKEMEGEGEQPGCVDNDGDGQWDVL